MKDAENRIMKTIKDSDVLAVVDAYLIGTVYEMGLVVNVHF